MKKFVLKLFIFALILVVCDVLIGFIGGKLVVNAKGGNTARRYNVAYRIETDVAIFGSSRAQFHYDPDILEDSLRVSAYNCGLSGDGIICTYGYYKMLYKRYHPAIIIYDVYKYDLLESDNHRFLGNLRFFYNDKDVASILSNIDSMERYKMLSHLYKYNSKLPQLIIDNIYPIYVDKKGYRPMNDVWLYVHNPDDIQEIYKYDSLKLDYLERLINDCKGKSRLIFTVSPLYGNTSDEMYKPLKELCTKYDIPLINHYTDTTFNNHSEYFADSEHLNRTGATKYSATVAHEIKGLLSNDVDKRDKCE